MPDDHPREVTVLARVYASHGPYTMVEHRGVGRLGQHPVELGTELTGAPHVRYRDREAALNMESVVRALAAEIDKVLEIAVTSRLQLIRHRMPIGAPSHQTVHTHTNWNVRRIV